MLTHEQAAFLRAVDAFAITHWTWTGSTPQEVELAKMVPFCHRSGEAVSVNELGRQALADYGAKYAIVECSELAELRQRGEQIEEFLDFAMIGNNQIEFGEEGGLRVHWVQVPDDDYGYWVIDTGEAPPTPDAWPWHEGGREHCGDALREAFCVWCAKRDVVGESDD